MCEEANVKRNIDSLLSLQTGDLIEAKDFSNVWYKSRIIDIDKANNRMKIHFLGWNSRYDQWFDTFSGDLRLFKESTKSSPKKVQKKPTKAPESSTQTPQVQTESSILPENRYPIGSTVLAKWIDDQFYPAKVHRHVIKTTILYYEVKFYDGIKKLIRYPNVKEISDEELKLYQNIDHTIKKPEDKPIENSQLPDHSLIQSDVSFKTENIDNTFNASDMVDNSDLSTNDISLRKSARVKRPKTFKDEIVFYSSASTSLASTSNTINNNNLNSDQSNQSSIVKKRKTEPSTNDDIEKIDDQVITEAIDSKIDIPKDPVDTNDANFNLRSLRQKYKNEKFENLQFNIKKNYNKELVKKLIKSSKQHVKKCPKLEKIVKGTSNKPVRDLLASLDMKTKQDPVEVNEYGEVFINPNIIDNSPNETLMHHVNGVDGSLIKCNFSNCDKTFRKETLLEYHLKYHHYVNLNMFGSFEKAKKSLDLSAKEAKKDKSCKVNGNLVKLNDLVNYSNNVDFNFESNFDQSNKIFNDEDPYEVVHCNCGQNNNVGFMIQVRRTKNKLFYSNFCV